MILSLQLSDRYRHLSELKDLLYYLLHNLVALLESEYPVGTAPIQHTVPTWAICSFIGCIVLSAVAAFVGNCVTNRGSLRSASFCSLSLLNSVKIQILLTRHVVNTDASN